MCEQKTTAIAINKIEGLDKLKEIRSLFLHQNCIERIEGLEELEYLDNLNLSENFIKRIENLKHLQKLTTLSMHDNSLENCEDIIELADCHSITILDLSKNKIHDPEILPLVLSKMPNLRVLKLEGNPVIKKIPHYRKTMIAECTALTYLDSMPVFDDERRLVTAWKSGGVEEERREREKMRNEKKERERHNFEAFETLVQEAREKRNSSSPELSLMDDVE